MATPETLRALAARIEATPHLSPVQHERHSLNAEVCTALGVVPFFDISGNAYELLEAINRAKFGYSSTRMPGDKFLAKVFPGREKDCLDKVLHPVFSLAMIPAWLKAEARRMEADSDHFRQPTKMVGGGGMSEVIHAILADDGTFMGFGASAKDAAKEAAAHIWHDEIIEYLAAGRFPFSNATVTARLRAEVERLHYFAVRYRHLPDGTLDLCEEPTP